MESKVVIPMIFTVNELVSCFRRSVGMMRDAAFTQYGFCRREGDSFLLSA